MSAVKQPSRAQTVGQKLYVYFRTGCWYLWFLFLFTISEDSYFNLSFLPNVNRNYNQKFNTNALLRCLFLLFIFGLHHSIFIRASVKKYLSKKFKLSQERQLEIYASVSVGFLYLIPIFWILPFNQIGGGTIWNTLNIFDGYIIVNNLLLILMIYLFKQVLSDLENLGIIQSDKVVMEGCYGIVRHPAQACMLGMMWLTPLMTVPRFVFALTLTIYIMIGLYYEEKDLINKFGKGYIEYKKIVPAFIPYRLVWS